MKASKYMPKIRGKFEVIGSNSQAMVEFMERLGIADALGKDNAEICIVTQATDNNDFSGRTVVYPCVKGFDKSLVNADRIFTYAVENNSADYVAKNVRDRDGFKTFELLSLNGIGRVYVNDLSEASPSFALALAAALMAVGLTMKEAIEVLSD
ncbi:MAG: hypothetical protein K2M82_06585 [Lachnospiraceae bacterium]|nr:hypothetical protein [Lachnospiraceae bacterium]